MADTKIIPFIMVDECTDNEHKVEGSPVQISFDVAETCTIFQNNHYIELQSKDSGVIHVIINKNEINKPASIGWYSGSYESIDIVEKFAAILSTARNIMVEINNTKEKVLAMRAGMKK